MPTYLVDHDLPGLTRAQFSAAHRATVEATCRAAAGGTAVRYLLGFFVPSDGRAACLFEAPDAYSVHALNVDSEVPFSRLSEVIHMVACASPDALPGL